MKINYVDYQQDILAKAVDSEIPKIYVFDNFENLKNAREYYKQPFLKQKSCFITMMDFKEKLFPTGKLIIREEKLAILFYQLLTADERSVLGIENYFDAIDLSAKFFNFYKELHEYKIDKVENLREWQQDKYEIMESVRKKYYRRLDELGYIDSTMAFDFKYFTDYFLRDYKEVVFINKIYFTPRERDLLGKIEECGYDVQLYLQLDNRDFDQSNLRIKSFSLPESPSTEIELYHTEEDFLQVVNFISIFARKSSGVSSPQPLSLFPPENYNSDYNCDIFHGSDEIQGYNEDKNDFCVLDANFTKSSYQQLLSEEKIKVDKEIPFTETLIYKFLDTLYNIISNVDYGVDLKLELKSLLEACYWPEFRNYYNLSKADLKNLQQLAADDYIYLSAGFIGAEDDKFNSFKVILEDIKKINGFKNIYQFVEFLEKIDLQKLNDSKFTNTISQYFDALLEMYSIEEMNIVSSWNKYFASTSLGLFRLVLNYLKFKQVNLLSNNELKKTEIKELLTAPHLNQDDLIILNASRGIIPSENNGDFIITEKQRAELGLKTSAETRLEERYYFFRHLLSSRRVLVFSLKNLEENITTSSFVDELMLKYGLEQREMLIKGGDFPNIIRNVFSYQKNTLGKNLYPETILEDRLMIEKNDFQDSFSLAYYKYSVLKDCYYKFYLEHIAQLKEDYIEISKELGPRVLGILVHDIFADIIEQNRNGLKVDESQIRDITVSKFNSYYLKINNYYKKYYRDILLPRVQHSIVYFFYELERIIQGKIKNILTEWNPGKEIDKVFYQNNLTNIYLNGRIDLLINTDDSKYLVDFKTGSGDLKQLDFYSLLINPDLTGDHSIDKAIYTVLEEKFETGKPGSEVELAEEIMESIEVFFNGGDYKFEYKSICERCIMTDICRVV